MNKLFGGVGKIIKTVISNKHKKKKFRKTFEITNDRCILFALVFNQRLI